jgi:serine protease Do
VESPAQIEEVHPNTAAQKVGLKAGDVIKKVNGKEIKTSDELVETIKSYLPGQKVELVIERNGKERSFSATLGSRSQLEHGERAEFQNSLGGTLSERRAGFVSVIQHDSMLKAVDCGGPIVDLDGKAVGLNIARAGRVESFALPAQIVREAVKKLMETQLTSTPTAVER